MTTYVAQGTIFARGDAASPEVYTAIAQITAISGIGKEAPLIDVSNLSSSAREYHLGLEDLDEVQLTIQYDPDDTTHSGLLADADARTLTHFRITLTDSPPQAITFAARVRIWRLGEVAVDAVQTLIVGIKPSGDWTVA